MSPRISVLMSIYNGEQYLREAIESILGQVFSDFDFIIVDDGSMDSSLKIAQRYAQEDARIQIIKNAHNIGLSASLNKALQAAQGEFIARMDADDVSLPHRLEEQAKFMDEHPEIDVLGTGFTFIDEAGNHLRSTVFSSNSDILRWNLLFFNPIAHPSAMMRSATIRKLGGYSIEVANAQDYELWTRVSLMGRLANLEEIHMLLRLHEARVTYKHRAQQISFTNDAKQKYLRALLKRNIPTGAVADLRQKSTTARHAAMTAAVILDYCNHCSKDTPAPVTLQILGPALEKTARKIGRFIVYPATWGIVFRLCALLFRFVVIWFRTKAGLLPRMFERLLRSKRPDAGAGLRYE